MALQPEDFASMRALLRATGLPLVAVQEGGYGMADVPRAAEAFWRAGADAPTQPGLASGYP